jgi:hypothetical protein
MAALLACAAALIGGPSAAQTPAAPPAAGGTADGVPFDIPYGLPIGLETAKKLIAAAEAEAGKHHWKMNIAVVDTHGELVHFSRMDGASSRRSASRRPRRAPRRASGASRGSSTTSSRPATPP